MSSGQSATESVTVGFRMKATRLEKGMIVSRRAGLLSAKIGFPYESQRQQQ